MIPFNNESKKKTALNIVDKMTVWPQCKQTSQEKWISNTIFIINPKAKHSVPWPLKWEVWITRECPKWTTFKNNTRLL